MNKLKILYPNYNSLAKNPYQISKATKISRTINQCWWKNSNKLDIWKISYLRVLRIILMQFLILSWVRTNAFSRRFKSLVLNSKNYKCTTNPTANASMNKKYWVLLKSTNKCCSCIIQTKNLCTRSKQSNKKISHTSHLLKFIWPTRYSKHAVIIQTKGSSKFNYKSKI